MEELDRIDRLIWHEFTRVLKARNRLLLLDFDGTLIGFSTDYEKVHIPQVLKKLLEDMADLDGMRIVVISGRSRESLDRLFGDMKIDVVAEHGSFLKETGVWKTLNSARHEWKKEVLSVMNEFSGRVSGTLIEIKETSLVWHFRNLPVLLGVRLSGELKEGLTEICNNYNLKMLNGKMTLEVMESSVSKGTAVRHLIECNTYDYIMAFGDDRTDEDMFDMLSRYGYTGTVKIGNEATLARYYLKNYLEVRRFLKLLLNRISVEQRIKF